MARQRVQKPETAGLWEDAVKPLGTQDGQSLAMAPNEEKPGAVEGLLEQVLDPENLRLALARVKANKGAAGVDGMQVSELDQYLTEHWDGIREKLLAGTYRPAPVRRVKIPKPGGSGVRLLGVPTALDRLLQQMLHQVLSPIFDPGFSNSSYGFRPLRSAHQAVVKAKAHIDEGYDWMVEVDAEKYFDRVNHDVLMARVGRKVKDQRVLRLIRRFLRSGVMVNGIVQETSVGTPQGGPLSPLLGNVLLDDLDKELELRGHRFVRYADDITVFVQSRKAGERVLQSLRRYLEERLRIKVNVQKSYVDRPWKLTLLGFSFLPTRKGIRIRIASKSLQRAKDAIRKLTARSWSIAMEERIRRLNRYLRGWVGYFKLADAAKSPLADLDEWLRHRLRQCRLKEWKRAKNRYRELVRLGVNKEKARKISSSRKGIWRLSLTPQLHVALGNAYWRGLGLTFASDLYGKR